MEQLASEGITFTDAHSSAAWCIPSRYALLTGRYHWREERQGELGYYGPPVIKSGRLTVGDLLQQQGYTTACIGKWHLGMEWHMKDGSIIPNGRLNQQPKILHTLSLKVRSNADSTISLAPPPVQQMTHLYASSKTTVQLGVYLSKYQTTQMKID